MSVLDSILATVFPHACRVCGRNVGSLSLGSACADCWSATRVYTGEETLCPKCGRFLLEGRIAGAGSCHRCDAHLYDHAIACGVYEKALSATVIELKKKPTIPAFVLNLLCCRFENADLHRSDVVVPVPVSSRRLIERGFNQAQILASAVAREFGVPLDTQSLTRTVHTQIHRGGMDAKARDATVKAAFTVNTDVDFGGRRLILVDDVMTSGSTASHCADELKKQGAASVKVFTIARAL